MSAKQKQSSIFFTINKADFGRNFSNSGEMYKSWGVLIYDPLYFHWSTLWWSLIRRPLTKRSRGVLNFYASPPRWRLATHIVLHGCIYFILNIFCCVGFFIFQLKKIRLKKNMSWRLFQTCSKLMRFSINQHKKIFNTKIILINIFFYQRKLKKIRSFINDSSSIISTGQKSIFTLKYSVIFVVFSIASNTRGKRKFLAAHKKSK